MLILKPVGSAFEILGRVTVVQLPIRLLRSMSHGYPDIGVIVRGVAVSSDYEAVLSFDGSRYPMNPSMPPAREITAVQGKVIIATTENSVPLYD